MKYLSYLVILFLIDFLAVVVFKGILGQKTVLTIEDMFIPGLISGVGTRFVNLIFNILFFLIACLEFVANLALTLIGANANAGLSGDIGKITNLIVIIISDFIALFVFDILYFILNYIGSFNILTMMGLVFKPFFAQIQNDTGFPLLAFWESLEFFQNSIFGFVSGFLFGSSAVYFEDMAFAVKADYTDSSGYIKGDQHSAIRTQLENINDYIETRVVHPRTGVSRYYKRFVSIAAKEKFMKIWYGTIRIPAYVATVIQRVWREITLVSGVGADLEGEWVDEEVIVDVPSQPYVSESEKEGMLTKIKNNVYYFLGGLWSREEPPS